MTIVQQTDVSTALDPRFEEDRMVSEGDMRPVPAKGKDKVRPQAETEVVSHDIPFRDY